MPLVAMCRGHYSPLSPHWPCFALSRCTVCTLLLCCRYSGRALTVAHVHFLRRKDLMRIIDAFPLAESSVRSYNSSSTLPTPHA